jgi:hypothetical protein
VELTPGAEPRRGPRDWRCGRLETAAWLAVYAAGLAAAQVCGFRMAVPWFYYQLLPGDLLTDRLGESLWNLHAQPPLLDLLLGGALRLERAAGGGGLSLEGLLFALHALLGGVVVVATVALLRRLRLRAWLRAAVMALVLLDPAFYLFLGIFIYTFYELFWLSLAALAAHRLASRPGALACLGFGLPVVFLAYTRALFHPLWAAAALVAVAAAGQGHVTAAGPAAPRRTAVTLPLAVALLVPLALLAAWPLKNGLRFGVWGFSSWQGYNLSRGLPVEPPADWVLFSKESSPAAAAARAAALARVPERFRGIPALARVTNPDGQPNWNHYAMIGVSAELERRALAAVARQPSLLARKALTYYLDHFTVYSGRHPRGGSLDWRSRSPAAVGWLAWYERLSLQAPLGPGGASRLRPMALLFPLLAAAGAWRAWTLRSIDRPAAIVLAFLLGTTLWVAAMVLLVDGEEGNRMRFSTQPALWIGAAAALDGWLDRRRPQMTAPLEPASPAGVPT